MFGDVFVRLPWEGQPWPTDRLAPQSGAAASQIAERLPVKRSRLENKDRAINGLIDGRERKPRAPLTKRLKGLPNPKRSQSVSACREGELRFQAWLGIGGLALRDEARKNALHERQTTAARSTEHEDNPTGRSLLAHFVPLLIIVKRVQRGSWSQTRMSMP